MTDEDKEDLKTYNQAMAEHLKNPVVYSHNEVQKMLKIDFKPCCPRRRYNHPKKPK